jgi:hypothetical protein
MLLAGLRRGPGSCHRRADHENCHCESRPTRSRLGLQREQSALSRGCCGDAHNRGRSRGRPKAYAGLAFSYHELVTENFQRLTDQDWATMLNAGQPDVPWLSPVLGP